MSTIQAVPSTAFELRQLGSSDLHLTPIGYGAWAIGGGNWEFAWGAQDDDESVRTATTTLMRSLGHVAHSFASAQAFLQSADVDHSSCMIVDVQMPRMSGVELQSALLSQSRRIPIIFMTAYPEKRIRSRLLRSGAVCCISKPFRAQALIECIDGALKRHASHHGCKHARL